MYFFALSIVYVYVCLCVCLQLVSGFFLKHSEYASSVRRSSAARRHHADTVSAKFQSSLQELLEKMERFEKKHFILRPYLPLNIAIMPSYIPTLTVSFAPKKADM